MTLKFTINKAGLRQLERDMGKNIKEAVQRKLRRGARIVDGDAEEIAKEATKEIELAFKRLAR